MLIIMKKISMKKELCKILNMMIILTYMELICQDNEKILLFWFIYHVLSLLSLIYLTMHVIKVNLIYLVSFVKFYYISND